jgi:hypothetical protein
MGLLLNNAFQGADAEGVRRAMEGKRDAASIRVAVKSMASSLALEDKTVSRKRGN